MFKFSLKFMPVLCLLSISTLSMAQSVENHSINIDASNDLAFFQGKKGKLLSYFDGQPTQSTYDICGITTRFHPTPDAPYLIETQVELDNFIGFTFSSINEGYGIGDSIREVNNQGQIVYTNTFDKLSGAAEMVTCGSSGHMSWSAKNRINNLVIDKNSINFYFSFSCGLIPHKHVRSVICQY